MRPWRLAIGRRAGVLPDFVIIGAQRSGTTTLYRSLVAHPQILAAWRKELHFFDINYDKGVGWYRAQMPFAWQRRLRRRPMLAGESTPYYLFHPQAPARMAALLPNVKLIALLRNPVDRAFSHYRYNVQQGRESLPFAEALRQEATRVRQSAQAQQHFSYLARGDYAVQIARWLQVYRREQLLIVDSERFFREPEQTLDRIFRFLGVAPQPTPSGVSVQNAAAVATLPTGLRAELAVHFQSRNRALFELLGHDFDW